MAASNSTDTATPKRDRYYTPNPIDAAAPGVARREFNYWQDEYRGTAAALAAAGLLPIDRFPGMPGQNVVSATFRPLREQREPGEGVRDVPGHLTVFRQLDGTYRAIRTIERQERVRRRAEQVAQEAKRDAVYEAVLSELPRSYRVRLDAALEQVGGYRIGELFNDEAWLASNRVSEECRMQILSACDMLEIARIESRIVGHDLAAAKETLARFGDRVRR